MDKLWKKPKQNVTHHLKSVAALPCEIWMCNCRPTPLQQLFNTRLVKIVIYN